MPTSRGDLSPRELDVLHAVVEHRSNAEIAARFVLSVRTVESHVASLLRKTGATNRRELADLGAALVRVVPADDRRSLPDPPSTFVGRSSEQEALARALRSNRLVTALGPGGVGKTRIALAVARDGAAEYPDGAVYVDLVPVTAPDAVAAAVAAAAGVGAQQAASPEEALAVWLRGRTVLLVLDNCEHLLDGVAPLLERLLGAADGLTVLATSRTRLLVPFEHVFSVPGLSVDPAAGTGDAVELFRVRAGSQGAVLGEADTVRIARICARLDGMALAIELAAARVPSIGLDGLEAGLPDALDLLEGGGRSDRRHRSLRATIDWSVSLLADADRDVLLPLGVFAAPFDVAGVAEVLGLRRGTTHAALGRLADSSLVRATGGRYGALETVRQYGVERLEEEGRLDAVRARHLAWCLAAAGPDADFDTIAPDLRAAIAWASRRVEHRARAWELATRLGALAFAAGAPAEAQAALEQAAALAPEPAGAVTALRDAAGAAEARNVGLDALRLHRAAARVAESAGDSSAAAVALSRVGVLVARAPGLMAAPVPWSVGLAELDTAAVLAGTDARALAHVSVARMLYVPAESDDALPAAHAAIAAAAAVGDPVLENVALDGITSTLLVRRDIAAAFAASSRRIDLLDTVPLTAAAGMEFADAYSMTGECAMAAGDLPLAQRFGERVRTLPSYAREPHLSMSRTLTFGFLVGEIGLVTRLAPAFLAGWERAGRPRAGNLRISSQAVAAAYLMRGDDATAERWRALGGEIASPTVRKERPIAVTYLRAVALTHAGRIEQTIDELELEPAAIDNWQDNMWLPWYAALQAEAAVLAGIADDRVDTARPHVAENRSPRRCSTGRRCSPDGPAI